VAGARDVLLAREETRADYCFEKAQLLAPRDWFIAWLAARIRYFHEQLALAMKHLQRRWNGTPDILFYAGARPLPARARARSPARVSFTQAKQLNPACREASLGLVTLSQTNLLPGWLRRLFKKT